MKNKKLLFRISAAVIACVLIAGIIFTAVFTTRQSVRINTVKAEAHTTARGMCTVEVSSGRILYEKNSTAQLPMASTTKVVTAITVLENCEDIEQIIRVDDRAIGIEGTSIYLQRGEELTVRELLLGLMLRSGNDAAAALALYISPTDADTSRNEIFDGFSEKMQQIAAKAGAVSSSFKNPHGLDEEGHYTTARDLALISAYAMKNPVFAEIVATKSAQISGVEYPRVLNNKNRLLKTMQSCVGVKTGFTKKSGRCYVGAVAKNGMTVVCVVLNCGPMFEEAAALMEQADREFTMKQVIAKDEFVCDMRGIAREDFFYPLREGEAVNVVCKGGNVCVEFNGERVYCAPYNKF